MITLRGVIGATLRARALPALALALWLALAIYSLPATLDCVPQWLDGRGCDHSGNQQKRNRHEQNR